MLSTISLPSFSILSLCSRYFHQSDFNLCYANDEKRREMAVTLITAAGISHRGSISEIYFVMPFRQSVPMSAFITICSFFHLAVPFSWASASVGSCDDTNHLRRRMYQDLILWVSDIDIPSCAISYISGTLSSASIILMVICLHRWIDWQTFLSILNPSVSRINVYTFIGY